MKSLEIVPETTSVYLPSAGLNQRRATLHVYDSTIPAVDKLGQPGRAHLFRCTETGSLRRWGFEGA